VAHPSKTTFVPWVTLVLSFCRIELLKAGGCRTPQPGLTATEKPPFPSPSKHFRENREILESTIA
jgi:hypothetical protein